MQWLANGKVPETRETGRVTRNVIATGGEYGQGAGMAILLTPKGDLHLDEGAAGDFDPKVAQAGSQAGCGHGGESPVAAARVRSRAQAQAPSREA